MYTATDASTTTPITDAQIEEERRYFRDKANDDGLDYALLNHEERLALVDPRFRALRDAYVEVRRLIAVHVGVQE